MLDLKAILQRYPESVKNKVQFKNILRDTYPEMNREINVLVDVLEAGIALQINQLNYMTEKDIKSYLTILEKFYGIAPKYGVEALYNWAECWKIPYDKIKFNETIEKKSILKEEEIYDVNSVIYQNKNIELTYLGIEILGGNKPYGLYVKFIVQNKIKEKITFYDDIVVINGIGFSINTFAESQAGYRKIINFYIKLEQCKYCGVQSIKDIHDLAIKLYYVINDKKFYMDEKKLKLVFI